MGDLGIAVLVLVLILVGSLAAIAVAPKGTPGTVQGPNLHYTYGGSPIAEPMVTGLHFSADPGSIWYVDSHDLHPSVNTLSLQSSAVPLTYGLVGYWPLDEGSGSYAYDLSGNNNMGTLENSPTWESGSSCEFGRCLSFVTASSQYVLASDSALPSGNNNRTLSAWIYVTTPSTEQGIEGYGVKSNNEWTQLLIYQSNLYFAGDYDDCEGNQVLSPNTWYFVAATYVGSSRNVILYVDNTTGYSCILPYYLNSILNGVFTVGQEEDNSHYFGGQIDDVRIYNVDLTAAQIDELYHSTVPDLEYTAPVGSPVTFSYYPQSPMGLTSGQTYYSLGVLQTAGETGQYWVDQGKPILYTVTES